MKLDYWVTAAGKSETKIDFYTVNVILGEKKKTANTKLSKDCDELAQNLFAEFIRERK